MTCVPADPTTDSVTASGITHAALKERDNARRALARGLSRPVSVRLVTTLGAVYRERGLGRLVSEAKGEKRARTES